MLGFVVVAMVVGGLGLAYWLQERQAAAGRLALAVKEASLLYDQAMSAPEDLCRWRAALESLKLSNPEVVAACAGAAGLSLGLSGWIGVRQASRSWAVDGWDLASGGLKGMLSG